MYHKRQTSDIIYISRKRSGCTKKELVYNNRSWKSMIRLKKYSQDESENIHHIICFEKMRGFRQIRAEFLISSIKLLLVLLCTHFTTLPASFFPMFSVSITKITHTYLYFQMIN